MNRDFEINIDLLGILKAVVYVAVIFLCVSLGLTFLQFRENLKATAPVIAQAQVIESHLDKAITDTSSMVNANLIHADLIMGRLERVSRDQETYWKMASGKTSQALDNANRVLTNLATTTQDLDKNLNQVSQSATETLNQVQPTLQATTQAINSVNNLVSDPSVKDTLKNVDQGTTQAVGILKNTNDTTADIKQKVHDTLHPKWPQRVYGWLKNALTLAWIVK